MRLIRLTQPFGLALMIAAVGGVSAAARPPEAPAASEESTETAPQAAGADTDPTKPVLFSVREEFYDLPGDRWQNVVFLRRDALALKKKKLPGHARGLILRADLPLVSFDDGAGTTNGLGDLYAQALMVPQVSPGFMVAVGTGLGVPTATDDKLGRGKWIASPAVVPVWFFPHRGYAYVKVQDWISFAGGGGRPDVHYLTVTPTWLRRIGAKWWTLLDAESTTNWERDDQSSFRAGVLMGKMLSSRHGLSVKVEIPFGGFQQTDWAVKTAFFRTKV